MADISEAEAAAVLHEYPLNSLVLEPWFNGEQISLLPLRRNSDMENRPLCVPRSAHRLGTL